jgi:hypothetical protein
MIVSRSCWPAFCHSSPIVLTANALAHDPLGDLARVVRPSLAWARARAIELALIGYGIGLRIISAHTHPPRQGYDFIEHEAAVNWWSQHFQMPPLLLSRGAYHPQLYYVLGGLIRRAGGGWGAVQGLSVFFGSVRLGLIFFAATRYLSSRAAVLMVLALAAVMPASVQMDAMVTQESLNNLVAVAFVIVLMETCRAPTRLRFRWAIALGLVCGLSLLVKISGFVLFGVLMVAPLVELVQSVGVHATERASRLRSWALAIAVTIATCGGQYAYNRVAYGKAVLDGWYKRPTADTERVGAQKTEITDRRTLGFFLGLSTDVLRFPYYPADIEPRSRFWPVLIASSFCDYYNYRFGPPADVGAPVVANGREVGERATDLGRASVAGGTVIALASALAWPIAILKLVRRREVARPLALLVPALAVMGQLFFATEFPYDFEGVVKGVYFHFATLPLYALFGTAFARLWRTRLLRPGAMVLAMSVIPVAAYTTYCAIQP